MTTTRAAKRKVKSRKIRTKITEEKRKKLITIFQNFELKNKTAFEIGQRINLGKSTIRHLHQEWLKNGKIEKRKTTKTWKQYK